MTDMMASTAWHLRHRALQYRALAGVADSNGIAQELCAIAADYERDAARLEARLAKARAAVRFDLN